ncbi:MAG: hypothetical protein MRY74_09330 [Neomegalonema sp.]|nr:hypothetical protein [Neomegalonema sp.]
MGFGYSEIGDCRKQLEIHVWLCVRSDILPGSTCADRAAGKKELLMSEATAEKGVTSEKQPPASARPNEDEIRIWGHSTILYWWVVWLYGYVCAALSYYGKAQVTDGLDVAASFHSSPWVGSSFLLLVLFIIIFSAVPVKGYLVLITLLFIVVVWLLADDIGLRIKELFNYKLPPVYMSFGFYLIISTVILFFWLVAVLIMDRLNFWRFTPRAAEQVNFHYIDDQSFSTVLMQVRARPVDFLRKILGLGMTRDVVLSFNTGGKQVEFAILNAWNVDKKLKEIRAMNAAAGAKQF